MLTSVKHLQVAFPVVGFDSIAMVYNLGGKQLSTKHFFGYQSMLMSFVSPLLDLNVSIATKPSAWPQLTFDIAGRSSACSAFAALELVFRVAHDLAAVADCNHPMPSPAANDLQHSQLSEPIARGHASSPAWPHTAVVFALYWYPGGSGPSVRM